MDFHPELINHILIQSAEEGENWHTSNYSLLKISDDVLRFYDFEEKLIQQFPYEIDDQSNILILPDKSMFGKILQQGTERLMIAVPEAKPLHFTKVPDTTLRISAPDIESLMADSHWTSHQLGIHLQFSFVSTSCLHEFSQNTGIPETTEEEEIAFQFTIVRPFGKWFLLMFAEQVMVEALPVHMLSDSKIEVYASLLPPTIRVLSRVD